VIGWLLAHGYAALWGIDLSNMDRAERVTLAFFSALVDMGLVFPIVMAKLQKWCSR
jgi:hypothetical protein